MTNTNNTPAFAPEIQMHHATRAKATRLASMLEAEYPALVLVAVEGDEVDHEKHTHRLGGWAVEANGEAIWEGEAVPELADLLEACEEAGIDPTEGEEEEEEARGGSVVPEAYRQQYAIASTTGQGNGDWLYETLAAWTLTPNGKDVVALDLICRNNGIDPDTTKWGQARILESRGWKGRYSMSARIALEMPICRTGLLRDVNGEAHFPPAEFLEDLRSKHVKALAKEARQAEREAAKAAEAAKAEEAA